MELFAEPNKLEAEARSDDWFGVPPNDLFNELPPTMPAVPDELFWKLVSAWTRDNWAEAELGEEICGDWRNPSWLLPNKMKISNLKAFN